MSGAVIAIPFAIGAEVWWTGHSAHEVAETCPECAGTRVLTLLKGSGERVSIDCNYCQVGYLPPTGTVRRTIDEYRPTPFVCTRVTQWCEDGVYYSESREGTTCYTNVPAFDLYATREECEAACAAKTAAAAEQRRHAEEAQLESKRRSLAHSTHYWKRLAERLEREAAIARARLAVEIAREAGTPVRR